MSAQFPASLLATVNEGVPLDEEARDFLRAEFLVFNWKRRSSDPGSSVVLFSEFVAARLAEIRGGDASLLSRA